MWKRPSKDELQARRYAVKLGYEAGLGIRGIATEMKVSPETVRKDLILMGVERRRKGWKRK